MQYLVTYFCLFFVLSGYVLAQGHNPDAKEGIRYSYLPRIKYPADSYARGEEGKAIVRALVNPAGQVVQAKVVRSTGYPKLDLAAMNTARKFTFNPLRDHGQRVSFWVLIPIRFSLETGKTSEFRYLSAQK